MIQSSNIPRLAQERLHGVHGIELIAARYLDGDGALRPIIVAQIHVAEAAAAQAATNLVTADALGREGRCAKGAVNQRDVFGEARLIFARGGLFPASAAEFELER